MHTGKKWDALSFRVGVLCACAGANLLLLLAGYLIGMLTGRPAAWVLLTAAALFAALGAAAWFWVALPYRKWEKYAWLLLTGYASAEEEDVPGYGLSPTSRRMLEQLREMLSPSQLFNINKRQAQYLALQNQINPHFLYNTLESIRSETMIAHLDSVADMTEALASFFRYTISKVENLVSVEEELQNCETYFRIQQYRFGERLALHIECDPQEQEEIYRCRLPKLTMQPILENSIIHGTELKIGAGHLTIHLERTGKRLLIRISDDGVGMDEATLAKLNRRLTQNLPAFHQEEQSKGGGLALTNVNNRVRLLFGEEYGLHVFSLEGSGTDVELTLPAITSDRDVKNREALQ